MRTPEEIKKGLEYCSEKAKRKTNCSECIYFNDPRGWCSTAITRDALAYIQQLEAQMVRDLDAAQGAHWIPCAGKSHIWYCSRCGERINYNQARRTYKPEGKPVHEVNRWCRGCGAKMMEG